MKAKLIKEKEGVYSLLDGNRFISTTECKDGTTNKLSKENCDEIFGVVDVEKLAEEEYPKTSSWRVEEEFEPIRRGYLKGYNKAMELNDKLFTVEDIKKAYMDGVSNGHNFGYPAIDQTDKYVQSLQQPTEIEVRIAMGCSLPNGCTEPDVECTCEPIYNLDENGCLTLWVLNT
jgi:hypothetical protein